MRGNQSHPALTGMLWVGALALVGLLCWVALSPGDSAEPPSTQGRDDADTPATDPFPPPPALPGTSDAGDPAAGKGLLPAPPGGSGDPFGKSVGLSKHRVVLEVRSNTTLGAVIYHVPTKPGEKAGQEKQVPSFRLATTAYGEQDKAQLWGYGHQDTEWLECTIIVDGKTVVRQRVDGPWSTVYCQG